MNYEQWFKYQDGLINRGNSYHHILKKSYLMNKEETTLRGTSACLDDTLNQWYYPIPSEEHCMRLYQSSANNLRARRDQMYKGKIIDIEV